MAALVGLKEPGQDGAFLATGKRGPTGKLISVKGDLSYSYQIRRPRLNIDGNSGERMISMSFEYEVKEFAKSLGADLIGITSSESKYLKDNKASIEAILPSCKSLVVLAKRLNDDAISSRNIKIAQYDTICTYQELDLIMHKVTWYLKKEGYRAVSIPPNMPVDFSPEKRGMYGEVNQKCAAVAAGLGNIGINRLLSMAV